VSASFEMCGKLLQSADAVALDDERTRRGSARVG